MSSVNSSSNFLAYYTIQETHRGRHISIQQSQACKQGERTRNQSVYVGDSYFILLMRIMHNVIPSTLIILQTFNSEVYLLWEHLNMPHFALKEMIQSSMV